MSASTSHEPGVVLGSKPDGTVLPMNKEILLTPPSSPPSRTASIRRQHLEHPPLPETLQDLPAPDADVRATIDTLANPDVAHQDIRAPGANILPLDDLKGVPYFPDRSQLNGLPKTDVWNLIRRFDKQVSHVKVVAAIPPDHLDFQTAADDEFAPEGLRTNLERAYNAIMKSKPVLKSAVEPYRVSRPVAIVYGLRAAGRHVATLAHWHHRRRTACFAAGYFFAWYFHILMFSFVAMVMALIVHPPARTLLFPSEPIPIGPHPYADSEKILDRIAPTAATVTDKVAERIPLDPATEPAIPATKETEEDGDEYDTAIWQQAKPIAQILAVVADTWERFENALSPVPPFPEHDARRKLAAYLAPMLLAAPFVTPALVVRGLTFMLGIVLFGWPVVSTALVRSVRYLNASHPRWTEAIDPRHHILHGVPTNAQLTIALLRVAEAQRAPIPPPPANAPGPGDDPYAAEFAQDKESADETDTEDNQNLPSPPLAPEQLTTTATADEEYHAHQTAEQKDEHAAQMSAAAETNDTPTIKSRVAHKAKGAMARVLRKSARVTGKTVEHGRHARAVAQDHIPGKDSSNAGMAAGTVPLEAVDMKTRPMRDGPDSFAARHHGRRGHVVLTSGTVKFLPAATKARLAMLVPGHGSGGLGGDEAPGEDTDGAPTAAMALIDVVDIRKVGGPSTARELLAGAVEDNTEGGGAGGAGHGFGGGHGIPGGLVITDRWGHAEAFTTIDRRDELFDRLVAASPVRWEIGSAWD